jgi:hypothetical protein
MKAIVIQYPAKEGSFEVPGWIVDDTDGLLAIDQRYEADLESIPPTPAVWAITHIQSGFRVKAGDYTEAGTMLKAIGIAQRFYREAKARGWDLNTADPSVVTAKYKTMSTEEARAFWYAVAGWELSSAAVKAPEQPRAAL